MNTGSLKQEILSAENELLSSLRDGNVKQGVAIHLGNNEYHNIWNGEDKDYTALTTLIDNALASGLHSFDYQVSKRDFLFINEENVLETLTAIPVTVMISGEKISDPETVISILWRKIEERWRLAYLHASEKPKT